ncbi:hypothetical protein [Desulfotomaculum nigrificans]|uniref:hypothetical protein n=1 Tax=Desulfotomaculum nigrificans TaxID=1565 RepID=UPI0003129AA6|nr:hypothetical protein [Desulfotomaculum nigrificans]
MKKVLAIEENINEVEEKIDKWLIDRLDSSIPRNKYIYHCNLAFIDIVIDQKILFTPFEKHYLFSLSYNTHIAHLKLKEELNFDYSFDHALYAFAFDMILRGMQYSMLCDIFPLLHSGKATMRIEGSNIFFDVRSIPKKNYRYISDYSIRKALSYTLQTANGKFTNWDDEKIAMKLSDLYIHFWNENMIYSDYEPYSRLDWGGISFFFIVASMRRFNKLYKKDFDIVSLDSQKMMILLSHKGVEELRGFVPTKNDELYKMALEDNIYKPIGKGSFPKLSVSEAPLNSTQDGFIFANPLVILFNDSLETRFLNYLRKSDNERYLRIKDKIKERVIPLIIEMIKYKFSETVSIPNFHVKIPLKKKNKRECDLLIVDEYGFALYLEIKHFYYPQSFCETKKVDAELTKALEKMPDQLNAISENWGNIKSTYRINTELTELHGIIVSHRYLGYDVEIDLQTPIVSAANLYESIAEANNLREVFLGCKEIDDIYPTVRFIRKELSCYFAGYNFNLEIECLDPLFEISLIKSYREQIYRNVTSTKPKSFDNISDLAHAYLEEFKS